MRRYFLRKLVTYLLTFFVAVTVDWMIPRFMPGDPVSGMLARMNLQPDAANSMMGYFLGAFGLDQPALAAVPQLLGRALPRRPGHQRVAVPAACHSASSWEPCRTPWRC